MHGKGVNAGAAALWACCVEASERGDVQSVAAVLQDSLGVKLYQLVS